MCSRQRLRRVGKLTRIRASPMIDYSDTPIPNLIRSVCRDYVARLVMHMVWVGIVALNFSVGTIERI